MSVSTVPAVLDAILSAVRAALPDVEVWDGQPVKQTRDDVICIAFTGEPGEAAVTATITLEQMAVDPRRESYTITCLASSWKGEASNAKAVRDRAYELVDGVVAALAQDQALGALVMRAMVSTQAFAQEQTTRGAVSTVQFGIHIDAYTR
ncbi:hypothetical protein FLW53_09605 [Microbispora sp. SCL1-1]|uniref:hypothetical protein n=1 Tax=unclassified Microbispora TaxID=2614687 RepID=UPI0011579DE1|nr:MULTISPECIES: hypothetical protein [unclassified Microbispora]NJP24459.1 hypothetical protein [Microbispora sp. CL1-1]TQS14605.1 hypothetical protein FLW53_09605 [Microbispora sp. SCL1-1]